MNETLRTSAHGLAFITKEEGTILQAYDDYDDKVVRPGQTVMGTLTIGVGHTSDAGPPSVYAGMSISRDESDKILAADLVKVEKQVKNLVKVLLNQNEFDALVSFTFNEGGGALAQSQLLKALNAGNRQAAADGFMGWTRALGKPDTLKGRRTRERELFLTPVGTKPAAPIPTAEPAGHASPPAMPPLPAPAPPGSTGSAGPATGITIFVAAAAVIGAAAVAVANWGSTLFHHLFG